MIDPTISAHYVGDCRKLLKQLPDGCVQTCVTSPPYWGLRDYGHVGQLGLEETPEEFVANMVGVFRDVRRVLRDDGTLWLNLGDCYAGGGRGGWMGEKSTLEGSKKHQAETGRARGSLKPAGFHEYVRQAGGTSRRWKKPPPGYKDKDLVGVPWMVAFALRADGWWLRQDIIWAKPNPMPESVTDRCTKSHEYIFLLSKSATYFYDTDAIAEESVWEGQNRTSRDPEPTQVPGAPPHRGLRLDKVTGKRNKRSVWTVATQPYDGAHFATFPEKLIEPCILAGSHPGDVVLDPFFGSGTTGAVAEKHGRRWIGFDLGYEQLAKERTAQRSLPMGAPSK